MPKQERWLDTELLDIVGLLKEILRRPIVSLEDTSVCSSCGCLKFPNDTSCLGCLSDLEMAMRRRNYTA